jgi:2,4-dienoyl-CoA reductase-like NADH-dependent reductase (Old Yellow Enzyme family)
MKTLFDETRIGTMRLRNRLVRSATWEAMADETGRLTPQLLEVYRELALGGVGLIITSATTVTKDATRPPGMMSIPDDSYISEYRELTNMVHDAGGSIVMQLVFPGRNGEMWTPEIPTPDDIRSIIGAFGDAAVRARLAGFNGVQIHAAHGYFLSQFLNEKKNRRIDEYGGPVVGRERFLLKIYEEIRARVGPDFPILVKINCLDFEEGDGVWDACRSACTHLAEKGIDGIEISGGTSGSSLPPKGSLYEESVFRVYAAEIAQTTTIPVILVGLNRTPATLTELLNNTGIEYFSLSRPFLRQPDLAHFWKKNSGEPAACLSCDACREQPGGNVCPFREDPVRQTCFLE